MYASSAPEYVNDVAVPTLHYFLHNPSYFCLFDELLVEIVEIWNLYARGEKFVPKSSSSLEHDNKVRF